MAKRYLYFHAIFVFVYFKCTICGTERRLFNSFEMRNWDKPFVVYFAKPREADKEMGWICMGTIVSDIHVVTAAACLIKNVPLYVVAGYRRYVRPSEWVNHECIRRWKKKVVKICTPQQYNYDAYSPNLWAYADIGVAEIDGKFNFLDSAVRLHCDYIPSSIEVNYQKWYVGKGGAENFKRRYSFHTYGWGHATGMNRPNDPAVYTRDILRWANLELEDETKCKQKFSAEMHPIIDNTALCVRRRGFLRDPKEKAYPTRRPSRMFCSFRRSDPNCTYTDAESNEDLEGLSDVSLISDEDLFDLDGNETRRNGHPEQALCQNDHGAPLTTFVGSSEMLIGVGSTSLYDQRFRCKEPSLYISTYDMSLFLKCVLENPMFGRDRVYKPPSNFTRLPEMKRRHRRVCDEHTRRAGFYIDEHVFDWSNITDDFGYEAKP